VKRDRILGLVALALAAAYYAAADALPRSLLSDGVGADGAPKLYAIALGLLGIVQIARTMPLAAHATAEGAEESTPPLAHLRALGVLAIGAAYIALTPYLGYPIATTILLYAIAVYAGQAHSWRTAAVSLGGGLVLWASFAKLLGVAMPGGLLGKLVG
jgi:hypothetical protein